MHSESRINSGPAISLPVTMAPATGRMSPRDRAVVLAAIGLGMNIVSGLREYLEDNAEFAAAVGLAGNSHFREPA